MTTFADILLHSPHGSCTFLDAVMTTMGWSDEWFDELMRERDDLLRQECRRMSEPIVKRTAKPTAKPMRVVSTTPTRRHPNAVAINQYAGSPWDGEES